MSGLLQRAAEYRANQQKLRLVRSESEAGFDELGGTPEERLAVLEQIDHVIQESRIEIGPDTFRVPARKRGIGLPLFVNLAALLVIAAGAYYLIRTFANQETQVAGAATTLTSTEGRLLRTLKEEADAQLSEKDQEIATIQDRLSRISAEREQLQSTVQAELSSREEELRNEFERALEAERARLTGQEMSNAEINRRLAEFESRQQAEYATQLDTVRAEAEKDLQEREAALNALVSEAEQSLSEAEAERTALETELRDQERRLTSQFAAREAELTGERAAAEQLLAELQRQQQQEQLATDQITAFYAAIQSDLAAQAFDDALGEVANLRDYLSQDSVVALPAIQRRRRVELFLADSLEARIRNEQRSASPDIASLTESAALVSHVTEMVAAAESAYGAGELENARTLYLSALSEIPAVKVGYDKLVLLDEQAKRANSERIAQVVRHANDLYRAGSYSQAAAVYGEALATLPSADDGLLSRILDAGYQLQRANDLTALRSVQTDLEAARRTISGQQELIDSQAQQLAGQREQLDSRAATETSLREELAQIRTELETARATTTAVPVPDPEQVARIDKLEAQLAERTAAVEERDGTIAQQGEQIAQLRASVADLTSRLAVAESRMGGLESEADRYGTYVSFYESQQELAAEIARYRDRFANGAAGVVSEGGPSALELLETKLIVLRIIGSPTVRAQYPTLTEDLNAYLDALVGEQRSEARRETVAEVNSILAFLLDDSVSVRATRAGEYPPGLDGTGDQADEFFDLLKQVAGP